MVCLWFQIQSDTSRSMTTNTFGISRDIPKGKMWLGDSTGEIEIMSVMSLNCVVLSSLWFLLCRTVLGSYGLIHSWWVKCCSINSFPLSLRNVLLCCRVVALSMSPVDDTFISGSLDKTIRLWDLRSPNCQVQYQIHVPTLCVVFSVRRMQNGCMLVRIQNYYCWCIVNTFPECWRSPDQKKKKKALFWILKYVTLCNTNHFHLCLCAGETLGRARSNTHSWWNEKIWVLSAC